MANIQIITNGPREHEMIVPVIRAALDHAGIGYMVTAATASAGSPEAQSITLVTDLGPVYDG